MSISDLQCFLNKIQGVILVCFSKMINMTCRKKTSILKNIKYSFLNRYIKFYDNLSIIQNNNIKSLNVVLFGRFLENLASINNKTCSKHTLLNVQFWLYSFITDHSDVSTCSQSKRLIGYSQCQLQFFCSEVKTSFSRHQLKLEAKDRFRRCF